MPGAKFTDQCKLYGVDFSNAVLEDAVFTNATLAADTNSKRPVNFSCSRLGGADFTNATLQKVDFFNALILLPGDGCCTGISSTFCGKIALNGNAYGYTKIDTNLSYPVRCPNGYDGKCKGADWRIPQWKAICGSSRHKQKIWQKPDCHSANHGDTVQFFDPRLRDCVMKQLFPKDHSGGLKKKVAA
ncbi:MAG: pentapeptide repeat-containing protein, partial [Bacteroidota bacterium]